MNWPLCLTRNRHPSPRQKTSDVEKFLASVLPETTVLLGQELKPLSLGHLLYLERLGCLPVDDPDKLVTATLICTCDFDEILPALQDPWLEWKVSLWRWRLGEVDWDEKYQVWSEYFVHHTHAPSVLSNHDGGRMRDSGTPFYQHLKVTLQSKLNYSPQEALNCPFGQALYDYYALHEIEGNIDVCDVEARREARDWIDENHDDLIRQVIDRQREGS